MNMTFERFKPIQRPLFFPRRSNGAQVGKLAFFRISDNLGPKAQLARSDNYANKPRRRRENFVEPFSSISSDFNGQISQNFLKGAFGGAFSAGLRPQLDLHMLGLRQVFLPGRRGERCHSRRHETAYGVHAWKCRKRNCTELRPLHLRAKPAYAV